eukprot:345483-Chlamydomonas_euryale.AAC.10
MHACTPACVQVAPVSRGCSPPRGDAADAAARAADQADKDARTHAARLRVSSRREEARMRHALLRLSNTYRDVRTLANNSVWPMPGSAAAGGSAAHQELLRRANAGAPLPGQLLELDATPGTARSGGGGGGGHTAGGQTRAMPRSTCSGGNGQGSGGGHDGGGVSFFAGEVQIKMPKTGSAAAAAVPRARMPAPWAGSTPQTEQQQQQQQQQLRGGGSSVCSVRLDATSATRQSTLSCVGVEPLDEDECLLMVAHTLPALRLRAG